MKTPLLFALAFATSISTTAYLTPVIAQAQQQQAQDQDEEKEASPSDKSAFLNAHMRR